RLASMTPPAWVFFHPRLDPRSATRIRAARKTRKEKQAPLTTEPTTVARLAPRGRKADPAQELLRRITQSLEDGKAEDIVTIDLAGKTTIADHMVVASGRSARQVAALTDHLEQIIPGR